MNNEPINIYSLQGLLDVLDKQVYDFVSNCRTDTQGFKLYYRGQANSEWIVESSIMRKDYQYNIYVDVTNMQGYENDHPMLKASLSVYEKHMINDVMKSYPNEFHGLSSFQVLSKLQHHGLPTRLIDITRNPFVAVFFACSDKWQSKKDGAIYVFYGKPYQQDHSFVRKVLDVAIYGNGVYNEEVYKPYGYSSMPSLIIDPDYEHTRIKAQQGAFVWENNSIDTDNLVTGIKIIIPTNYKENIIEQLDLVGINRSSLFPDLDNMTLFVKEHYIQRLADTIVSEKGRYVKFGIN